jgi:signal transduction histidine kinase
MTRGWIKITVLLLLATARIAVGQSGDQDELGLPFPSEHHAPSEYNQDPQNWDIVQDDRGLVYVANNDGVLQYDGERWRLIPTKTGTFVRSLAADSLVYVGMKGDFGYLRPDSSGVLRYTSLYEHVPENERDFEDIWGTHVLEDEVYYQANQRLFRWNGEEIISWSSKDGFHTSFSVDGTLYVRDFGRGLLRMRGDSLKLVPGGETFHETPIYMMARHPSGSLLVGTQNKGLLLYDGGTFRPLAPELKPYLQENDLYHGCRLPGDRYALATLGGGVIVIDAEGDVVRVLDGSSGLPDNVVNQVYAGHEGQLWMALNSKGVFRAGLAMTVHDERTGLRGIVRDIHEHRDTMYVSTASGLYLLQGRKNQVLGERSASFKKWGNLPIVWDMLSVGEELLVATQEKGAYRIEGREREEIADWVFTYDLLETEREGVVYAGTRSGLKGLVQTQEGWDSFSIGGVQGEIQSLATGKDGNLWASPGRGDVFRVVLSADGRRAATTQYGEQDGLPQGYKGVEKVNGRVTVVSKKGLFQVENPGQPPESWQFSRRSSLLPDVEGADTLTVEAVEEEGRRLWIVFKSRAFVGKKRKDDTYDWEAIDPLRFPKAKQTKLFIDQDSTVWLSDGSRLFRYGWGKHQDKERPSSTFTFASLVRQVKTLHEGKVVYGGSGSVTGANSSPTISYDRDIRIDVAAPYYGTSEPHEYRYKLIGANNQWSDWTNRASWRYQNLWEGTYRFQVQARNERGEISKTASLKLTVLPPWYRSVWAYFVYGLAFVGLAFGVRRYRQIKEENRRARERVRELERERVVAERLKKANERLREANRLKEDFLATTSHELRTPLTNILGALEVLRDMVDNEQEQFLDMIEQNGQRLKRTLNALLDLSMLRSGSEDLALTPTPLNPCVQDVASDLRDDAEEKGLSFRANIPDTPVEAEVDEQYLEQILRNLVENAIKYTHEGYVAVSTGYDDGHAYVEVEDSGIGIDEEFLPDLFEEFKQESRGRSRTYEGNGLGLAISARLAEQMDGTIHVETEKNQGSTFTVKFPRPTEASSNEMSSEVSDAEVAEA